MAFNPFHKFRKHQKVILSVVVIVLMLVFGLTGFSGGMQSWFGGPSQQSGPLVTKFKFSSSPLSSETKVYQADVDKTSRNRQWANDFMLGFTAWALQNSVQKLNKEPDPNKLPNYPKGVEPFVRRYLGRMNDPPSYQHLQEVLQDLEFIASIRQRPLQSDPASNSEEYQNACDTLTAAMRFELSFADPDRPRDGFFLGGSRSLDGLLDFMLWKHQAERLGITLNDTDVRKLINSNLGPDAKLPLTGSLLENEFCKKFFDSSRGRTVTEQELLKYLAEEFQVQLAQQALLGATPGSPGALYASNGIQQPPLAGTPDEFLNYVRDKRTTLKVVVLNVPVSKYLDPNRNASEERLRELYETYRNEEPKPDRRDPAFKQPRKVRIEYATGQPDVPLFKEKAHAMVFLPTVQQVCSGASAFPVGGGPAAWLMATSYPLTKEPILPRYERYQENERNMVILEKVGVTPDLYDRRYAAGALVGEVLAGLQQSGPFSISTTVIATNASYDQSLAKVVGATVLAGLSPTPMTMAAVPFPYSHSVLPLDQVAPQLLAKEEESIASTLVNENLDKLRAELTRLRGKPKEAKKYLENAPLEFTLAANVALGPGSLAQNQLDIGPRALGLVINGMSEAKDRYALASDPSIKVVRDEYEQMKVFMQQFQRGRAAPEFDEYVLMDTSLYQPANFFLSKVPLLWWRAEDKPARIPTYEEAKPEVLKAWRTLEARRDDRKYVRELIEKLKEKQKDKGWPEDATGRAKEMESFLAATTQGKVFALENVARLVSPETAPNLAAGRVYQTYTPPAMDIEYPAPNLVERLMTLQQPGDVVSFADRPENNYYVAVLVERSLPTFDDFRKIYENAENRPGHDPLWDFFVRDHRKEFQDQFIQRMREEATGELEDGKYKVDKDVRARYERSELAP